MRKKILNSVLFLCFLGGFIFSSASVHAAVWYVDGSAPGGDGTSWSSAFNNIQDAINACSPTWIPCIAPATEQIWVKAGTYSLEAQINVNRYVTIYGGFNGTETSHSQRDWENNITLVNGNDSVRCFYITEPATINGFNIRRGRASNANGGGIYIDSPPVYCSMFSFYHVARIRNCNINHNSAEVGGGGIYDLESNPVITNCIFLGNYATSGGGIKNWQSSPVIEKCRFQLNHSTAPGSWGGGAICSDYKCYGTITNCIFYLNESNSWGGAIAYHMAYPYITNCTFSENEAAYSGGAIYSNTGGPRVKNCIFWDDTPDEILSEFTSSTWPYVKYSDIKGGYSGTGSNNIDNDPEFVNPPIDLYLQAGSPCIDTGSNTGAPSDDIDGVSRPQDGDGDATAICDMGAYEFTGLPAYKGDFDGDGDVDGSDLADFAEGTATISLEEFAIDFGRTEAQQASQRFLMKTDCS